MWVPTKVIESYQEKSGAFIVRVELTNEIETQSVFFKFQSDPTEEDIDRLAQTKCDELNRPSKALIDTSIPDAEGVCKYDANEVTVKL